MIKAADDFDAIHARLQQLQGRVGMLPASDIVIWANTTYPNRYWIMPKTDYGREILTPAAGYPLSPLAKWDVYLAECPLNHTISEWMAINVLGGRNMTPPTIELLPAPPEE